MSVKLNKKNNMKKTRMMIVIDTPTRKRLLDFFKVSYPTLKSALEYKTHTPQAKKIRKAALEMGGRVFSSENGF